MSMKLDGNHITTVIYNDRKVKIWKHNEVDIFSSKRVIYSAEVYFIDNIVPFGANQFRFIDSNWIENVPDVVYSDNTDHNGSGGIAKNFGTLTDIANKYKYIQIHYVYGAKWSSTNNIAQGRLNIFGDEYIVNHVEQSFSGNGVKTFLVNNITNPTISTVYTAFGRYDEILLGFGITKIILTNDEPTE